MLHFVVFLWLSLVCNQEVLSQLIKYTPSQVSHRSSAALVLRDGSNRSVPLSTKINSEDLYNRNMSSSKQAAQELTKGTVNKPDVTKLSSNIEHDATEDMKNEHKNIYVLPPRTAGIENITFEYRDVIEGDACPTGYVKVNGNCVKEQ